jgi:hypothetical protein
MPQQVAVGDTAQRSTPGPAPDWLANTSVAEWARHSLAALSRVYAKCIHWQDKAAMRRICEATRP